MALKIPTELHFRQTLVFLSVSSMLESNLFRLKQRWYAFVLDVYDIVILWNHLSAFYSLGVDRWREQSSLILCGALVQSVHHMLAVVRRAILFLFFLFHKSLLAFPLTFSVNFCPLNLFYLFIWSYCFVERLVGRGPTKHDD